MLGNYLDVLESAKMLKVHPETVKRLIREGKLSAIKFGNKWIIEKKRLLVFAREYVGKPGRQARGNDGSVPRRIAGRQ